MFQICFPDHCTYFPPKGGVFCGHMWPSKFFFKWHLPDFIMITWPSPDKKKHYFATCSFKSSSWRFTTAAQVKQRTQVRQQFQADIPKAFFGHDIFMASQWRVLLPTGGRKKNTTESCSFDQVGSKRKDIKNTKTEPSQQFAPQNS